MSYYSDLSADSSSDEESDDEGDLLQGNNAPKGFGDDRRELTTFETDNSSNNSSTKCILHLDIDCFYCQCEHIDLKLPESRPLAIGQKHIIVTSNYAARRHGVKKLQGREAAYKACPSLLIVEGSDLERYRKHGRKVYESFRACIKQAFPWLKTAEGLSPAVSRGRGMDEMHADVTCLVDAMMNQRSTESPDDDDKPIYIYGDQQETATLTEDQTGAEAIVLPSSNNDMISGALSSQQQPICQERLILAAQKLGHVIQQTILKQTGFTTTLGFSTNPHLAKLASDLQKPMSVNVLYPWRAPQLILSMPLRKIPDCGYKSIKLLHPALERFHGARTDDKAFWTCRDLLDLPKSEVKLCLDNDEQCDLILQRCRGIDTIPIVDDDGEAPKTISVENSFRRGTVISPEGVWKGLEELYVRLPRLLKDRRDWSKNPKKAFPTTLRLTARVVDRKLQTNPKRKRRPFVTRSKQVPFRGQQLMEESDPDRQRSIVQNAVKPLVQSLVLNPASPGDLNVTRLNIAVTKFQDVAETTDGAGIQQQRSPKGVQPKQQLASYVRQRSQSSQQQLSQHNDAVISKTPGSASRRIMSQSTKVPSARPERSRPHQSGVSPAPLAKKQKVDSASASSSSAPIEGSPTGSGGIDPATLAELPPQMVKEIVRDYNTVVRSNKRGLSSKPTNKKNKNKTTRIDQFFKRR